jgi:hypothetical protein
VKRLLSEFEESSNGVVNLIVGKKTDVFTPILAFDCLSVASA